MDEKAPDFTAEPYDPDSHASGSLEGIDAPAVDGVDDAAPVPVRIVTVEPPFPIVYADTMDVALLQNVGAGSSALKVLVPAKPFDRMIRRLSFAGSSDVVAGNAPVNITARFTLTYDGQTTSLMNRIAASTWPLSADAQYWMDNDSPQTPYLLRANQHLAYDLRWFIRTAGTQPALSTLVRAEVS